jgi:phosphopantothenoylcysteine synthetase/decarboxylase
VTAGPTFESLDNVRRLTNFSTGRLGSELVNYLADQGHEVVLLIGQQATWRGERNAARVETFTTTADLRDKLQAYGPDRADAIVHAAAVSDFTFGKIWHRSPAGQLEEVRSGKISTREGTLLAELVPTPKLISNLRLWFPNAVLVGWKYEVDSDRESVIEKARSQIAEYRTTACVANGPAYGAGYGLVRADIEPEHMAGTGELFRGLEALLLRH